MKHNHLALLLLFVLPDVMFGFDTEKASTKRFKVEYVEPDTVPPMTKLPDYYQNRQEAIDCEQRLIGRGTSTEEILRYRKQEFRYAVYPIRVTDVQTGNVYEVQSDRRTIIAKKPGGEVIWTLIPYKDLEGGKPSYRGVKHPFISFFGKSDNMTDLKGPVLGISYTTSAFGDIELKTGKFHWLGND